MKPDHKHLAAMEREVKVLRIRFRIALNMAETAKIPERREYWFDKAEELEARERLINEVIAKHKGEW